MKKGLNPPYIIDIKKIGKLHFVKKDKQGIWIGPLVPHSEIESSDLITKEIDFLAHACGRIGSVQIRNRGTIGGNLCNASPAADTAAPLLVVDAILTLAGVHGDRSIPINDFFKGPGETSRASDELLTGIFIPKMGPNTVGIYIKHTLRKAMDIAKVGVAVLLTRDEHSGNCKDCRIALSAVAPVPFRAKTAEQEVTGAVLDDNILRKAADIASREASPISDVRSTFEYRREMVSVLTQRALKAAWEKIEQDFTKQQNGEA
jgi:CO/xanthine dehydrogenase FAD-binding subunit